MRIAPILFAVICFTLPGHAQQSSTSISVPAGSTLLFTAKGDGAQVYTCTAGNWTLKAPDAKLLDEHGNVIGTHFAGPTWRLTDGSEVKGKAVASQPSPDTASVPWLLLQPVPESGKGRFAALTYIRRTETHGGAAPQQPCVSGELRVPYTASYSFYVAQ
jgi:hypothetical protein